MPTKHASTTTAAWTRSIVKQIGEHPDRPLKPRALARELGITTSDYSRFRNLIRELLSNGTLVLGAGRTLRLPECTGLIVGTFRAHPRGFGFVDRPGQPGLYVPSRRTSGALDGDTVAARVQKRRGRAMGPRGEIVRVIERVPRRWVGVLERDASGYLVHPQTRDRIPPIRIDQPTQHAARPGDLVLIDATENASDGAAIRGRILERLGDPHDARVRIEGIIKQSAIPDVFPRDVTRAAAQAAKEFDPQQTNGRQDLRGLLAVTIDPPDARDFDDAISLETLAAGKIRLGVHIADVAHFVPPNGPVDLEARKRGTSAYFPGRVVPMLPEVLSNDVCCLKPGEPRFAKSVFMTYDRHAKLVDTSFCNSVILSDARLTYDEVAAALDGEPLEIPTQVLELLKRAERLARQIHQRRRRHGMISLTLPEVEIELDRRGRVTDARAARVSFAHTIIEMFMVEANEAVSRRLRSAGIEHLRRIHPPPDPTEAASLVQLAPVLGSRPPATLERGSIIALIESVRERPEAAAVSYVLLRSMPQARYSPSHEGHFALASDDYCHFTSPIRRYPDLTVHRLLETTTAEHAEREDAVDRPSDIDLASLGEQMSSAERRAQQAERDARATLLLMLMKRRLGEVFDGTVTNVTSFGAFVQLKPTLAEGLIRLGDFGPDAWHYNRRAGVIVGTGTGRVVYIGLPLRVLAVAVDELRMELALVPADGGPIGQSRRSLSTIIGTKDRGRRTRS